MVEEEEEIPQEEGMSEEEYLQSLMGTTATKEDRLNVHNFLAIVAKNEDTTRLGNLKEEEVGLPKLPLRTYKELALFCKEVANMDYFSDYFDKKGQILTATSLSKDAKLINLAVMQRREVTQKIGSAKQQENKGWFKKKEDKVEL